MNADSTSEFTNDTPAEADMRLGGASSPPVPGSPTSNNTQVSREGLNSSYGYLLTIIHIYIKLNQ